MIFQNADDQLFAPTVYQDVAFGPEILDGGRAWRTSEEVLDMLNIAHLRDRQRMRSARGETTVALAGILLWMLNYSLVATFGTGPAGCLEFNDLSTSSTPRDEPSSLPTQR